jgi:GR25 family glycosyltransferase involved in LPS biosynthesis
MSYKPTSNAPFLRTGTRGIVCLLGCGSVTLFLCFMSLISRNPFSLLRPYHWNAMLRNTFGLSSALSTSNRYHNGSETLGIASSIYVVSLANRTDRRQKMDVLAAAMGLRWTYVDSVDAQDEKILRIMDHVRNARKFEGTDEIERSTEADFWWPNDIDILSSSTEPIQPGGSDMWSLPLATISSDSHHVSGLLPGSYSPLTCSTNNSIITVYDADLPQHQMLTPSKIACWYSHVNVIRLLADHLPPGSEGLASGAAIVLEDDVDMELDIRQRLKELWNLLPPDWDIVFLGTIAIIFRLIFSAEDFSKVIVGPTRRIIQLYKLTLRI